MSTRLTTIGAAALIVMSGAVALEAQRGAGPRPGNPPPPDAQVQGPRQPGPEGRGRAGGPRSGLARLNLTADQQQAVTSILQKTRDEVGPLADELAMARRTLHRELFADKRDNGRINNVTGRVAQLEKQLLEARIKSQAAIADLLTPDQRLAARTTGVFEGGRGQGMNGPRGRGFQGGRAPRGQGPRSS